MAQVILVQPRIGTWDFARSDLTPPLALLSAVSEVSKEFSVAFIDQRKLGWKRKLRKAIEPETLCIATTGFISTSIKPGMDICQYAKSISDVPTIWGGVTATLLPETVLKEKFVDIIVRGDGEITFLEIVKRLSQKKSLHGVKGCWFKENNKIIKNEERQPVDMNKFSPSLQLIDIKEYLPLEDGRKKLFYESSRGCINSCKYCYNKPFSGCKWRMKSPEVVIKEINKAVKQCPQIEQIHFVDSNFFIDKQRALEISKFLTKKGLKWSTEGGHVEELMKFNDDELEEIDKSCKLIYCGVDSGSQKILDSCNRKLNIHHVIKLNKRMQKFNIALRYNFMVGFPDESLTDIKKTISLVFRLKKDNKNIYLSLINVLLLTPYTDMFNYAVKEGYKTPTNLKGWNSISTGYINLPWISKKRKKLLGMIYRNSYFLNKKHHIQLNPLIQIFMYLYNPIAEYKLRKVLELPEETENTG